ncbi:hypothetical protein CCAN11_2470035 [Capnocytophaga canimorsus]|uniref:Uncharacterized protein n=1 Tax=Capnocytophaga canimorsus TaxID=28188 RepID=A0A0B7IPI6_9FLAO|nr:hypothetical protein CCAN11_2470035 [Capnocytophaga canimorsus]
MVSHTKLSLTMFEDKSINMKINDELNFLTNKIYYLFYEYSNSLLPNLWRKWCGSHRVRIGFGT